MSYNFMPDAEVEYLEAVRFFEGQKIGLDASLISEFEQFVDLIESKPNTWKLVHPSGVLDFSGFRTRFSTAS